MSSCPRPTLPIAPPPAAASASPPVSCTPVTSSDGPHAPRATPIYLTAGFVFDDFDQAHGRFAGTESGFSYTRVGNPTNAAVERRIADLEAAE